jgi:flagellar hook-associated protein 3 FlgL
MSAISSLSSFLQNMTLVQNSQNNIAKLSFQVDTGLKSQDLQGYGTQANQLLNLQSGQTTEQNYVSNNTQTSTYLSAYDSTMGQIKSDASKLSASLDAFTVTDPTTVSNLQALVKGLQVDVSATLNTQVGGRYLYGGTRYTTAPVGDLSALGTPATTPSATPLTTPPTVNPLVVATSALGTLPAYDTQATAAPAPTAAQIAQTYAQQTTAVADNQTTSYGLSSTNPTFQHLIFALQNAQAAAAPGVTALDQQAFIKQATSEIALALNGSTTTTPAVGSLESLQNQNATAQTIVANANTVHTQTLATLQSQITTISQVDPATVAAELSAAQTQLQGSYKVVSSVLSDTLLNYLK